MEIDERGGLVSIKEITSFRIGSAETWDDEIRSPEAEMMTIEIRALRPADCDEIGPLLREIWLAAYSGIQTDEELLEQSHRFHAADLIALEVDAPKVRSIVAICDGRMIGHARSDLVGEQVNIFRLYLLREFHGQGIGKAMLEDVESYFGPKYEAWIEVYEENRSAVDFYLGQGYQVMERVTEVQTEGEDVFELKMRKSGRKCFENQQDEGEASHPSGWLVGAVICWLFALPPALYVYSEWKDLNEFTALVTFIPGLIALGFGILGLVFLGKFSERMSDYRKKVRILKTELESENADQSPQE